MRLKTKRTTLSQRAFVRLLIEENYKLLGKGCYAKVFAIPNSDRVLKVGLYLYEMRGRMDGGYLDYVKAIGLNNPNPLFPNIYEVKLFNFGKETYFCIEMEKLERLKYAAPKKENYTQLGINSWCVFDNNTLKYLQSKNNFVLEAKKMLLKLYKDFYDDIHSGNIMWRFKNNQYHMVITDPVADL